MAILPFLLGASIAVAPLPQPASVPVLRAPAQPAVQNHPALWVINDNDTTIYLFGTFHALDGKSDWFEQGVKSAFSQSDLLMLETLVPEPPRIGQAPPLPPLNPNAGSIVKLAPSASSMLASSRTVMRAGRSEGMSTDRGADAILRAAAEDSGKPVGGLESFQFQLNMFNTLQDTPQTAAPDAKAMQALALVLAQLQAAWNRGDMNSFAVLLRQMQTQTPKTYQTMFVDRNTRWAHWISQRLSTPGTVFVAVGAGHLSGPDSVQNQLASLGVKSIRIN